MSRHVFSLICVIVLYSTTTVLAVSKPFSVLAFLEQHVTNDAQFGPDQTEDQIGVHVRDIPARRRVGLFSFDISALKGEGVVFSNISLSNLGAGGGNIDVYGVLEGVDNLPPRLQLTWNNAPGVKNDPAPPVADPVELDFNDLSPLLLTFDCPDNQVRESTATSQALADFINSDTDGIITLLFAPPQENDSAILRTVRSDEGGIIGGTYLEGSVGVPDEVASDPSPAKNATDVYRDTLLSWTPGIFAVTHDIYFGTDANVVHDASRDNPMGVLVSQDQADSQFDPGRLDFERTYHWRVDEVNAGPDFTVYKGGVWSLTVESETYPIQNIIATASSTFQGSGGPEATVDGSGLDPNTNEHGTGNTDIWASGKDENGTWIQFEFDLVYQLDQMLVWNANRTLEDLLGFGFKDVLIEYSLDGKNWTALPGDHQFDQAPGQPGYALDPNNIIDFGRVAAKFVKITAISSWAGRDQKGLSEVRFLAIPTQATHPVPADGATGVDPYDMLSWRPGRESDVHTVSLSDDMAAVENGTAVLEPINDNMYDLSRLDLVVGQQYYWKIDESNDLEDPSMWPGPVWGFTVAESLLIDDFEAYKSAPAGLRPYVTWRDGLDFSNPPPGGEKNGTGSMVGYDIFTQGSPYYNTDIIMEPNIVNSGEQSLPFYYDNSGTDGKALYSEMERTFDPPQDWTRGGVNYLQFHFYGDPNNAVVPQMYIAITDNSNTRVNVLMALDTDVQTAQWQDRILQVNNLAVDLTAVRKLAFGIGNPDNPQVGGKGVVYVDDMVLIRDEP